MEGIDIGLVDWSRAQFALTAMYHWLFVPLTLGITFIIAIMESIYVKTGNEEWKRITKFWMNVFAINFAIGVATGIILEFEFGTNWSNYSWFVGDIFGAPLAIEGIMAFFLESTFIAVMFFGWDKVSKKFHLLSSWLVAIGSNLSALWILVANAWMQYPAGMKFNPDTVRNEMVNFWEVLFSPVAVNKFVHTVTSGYVLASVFVVGVSVWFLIKKRDILFAKRSIIVAGTFGLLSSGYLIITGDESARSMAKYQPMKFAAMEGLYDGVQNAPLVALGFLGKTKEGGTPDEIEFAIKLEIPDMLSYMAFLDANAFVPGIRDLINGRQDKGIVSYFDRIKMGKLAIESLAAYKKAKNEGRMEEAEQNLVVFNQNFKYFGYGYYYGKDINELIPSVRLSFYSFHLMVILGGHFALLFLLMLYFTWKNKIDKMKWLLWSALLSIPLAYIASEAGWVLAEVGRQPWVIQDLLPNLAAVSQIDTAGVQTTFFLFLILFTTLLIAEIKIMLSQIRKGPAVVLNHSENKIGEDNENV
ncbi:MAG: cytochrome ubiquinol oxidase subunit I [Bacteroidales bacterium]